MKGSPYMPGHDAQPYFSQVWRTAPDSEHDPSRPTSDRVVHTLVVDNRDRDLSLDGTYYNIVTGTRSPRPASDSTSNTAPYNFVVNFQGDKGSSGIGRFENVISVELKALTFPRIAGESYVVMDIDELAGAIESTDSGSHRSFAVVYFDNQASSAGDLRVVKATDHYQKIKYFNPPLAALSRLTVRFKRYGGGLVSKEHVGNVESVNFILEVVTANKTRRV